MSNGASVLGQNPVPMIVDDDYDYNLLMRVQNGQLAPPPMPALPPPILQNLNANQADPNVQALPPPPPLLRQIREDYWQMGEHVLQNNPNRDEVEVFFHHWHPDMQWQYKVVRVNGRLERQTWLNGEHVG